MPSSRADHQSSVRRTCAFLVAVVAAATVSSPSVEALQQFQRTRTTKCTPMQQRQRGGSTPTPLRMSSTTSSSSPESSSPSPRASARTRTKTSQALPFLKYPKGLTGCGYAGNAGFDPLNLASTPEALAYYREAEIKHSRLAMLVRPVGSE